jgi:phospholipase C
MNRVWFCIRHLLVPAVLSGLLLLQAVPAQARAGNGKWFDHVLIIVLENEGYANALQQDYMKQLLAAGTSFSHYTSLFSPSQPNYLALVGGSNFGVIDNEPVDVDGPSIADLLEAKGLTWKQYAQGFPGRCFAQKERGDYVRKHVPFISFKSIRNSPERCANIVSADAFDARRLPNFALFSPDNRNNGHDTGLGYAGRWLKGFLDPLLNDRAVMQDTLIVVTFDESDSKKDKRIFTVLLGSNVRPGHVSDQALSHYDLLRTIEDNFELGQLGRQDASASAITGIWAK